MEEQAELQLTAHIQVVRLLPSDARRYIAFRGRMLREAPWAFGASPEDDFSRDAEAVARMLADEESAVFAVEEGDHTGHESEKSSDLIAAAAVMRRKQLKFRHRASIWGVFVTPDRRQQGLGRAVVGAAVTQARAWTGVAYVDLGVSASSPEAARLYRKLGFVAWGREPEATQLGDRRIDEIHMTLRL